MSNTPKDSHDKLKEYGEDATVHKVFKDANNESQAENLGPYATASCLDAKARLRKQLQDLSRLASEIAAEKDKQISALQKALVDAILQAKDAAEDAARKEKKIVELKLEVADKTRALDNARHTMGQMESAFLDQNENLDTRDVHIAFLTEELVNTRDMIKYLEEDVNNIGPTKHAVNELEAALHVETNEVIARGHRITLLKKVNSSWSRRNTPPV
eukprot:scaffold1049_cov168-Amphora_coffeaeformis.AAC.4